MPSGIADVNEHDARDLVADDERRTVDGEAGRIIEGEAAEPNTARRRRHTQIERHHDGR